MATTSDPVRLPLDPEPPPEPVTRPAGVAVLGGLAAGILGLGVAETVAGFISPSSAPLVALGDVVVDRVPPWLKNFAVNAFGTHDKQVLIGTAAGVAALLSALAGVLAASPSGRRRSAGRWLVVVLGAVAAFAAATRPDGTMLSAAPGLVGALVGVAALSWMFPGPAVARQLQRHGGPAATGRRAVLGIGGGLALGTLTYGGGWLLGRRLRNADQSRAAVQLPVAADPAPALPAGVDLHVRDLSPFVTSSADFYRIDTALVVPRVSADTWRLRIHGMVDREVTIGYAELLASPLVERYLNLICVSNEVGGDLTGNARWLGLPLAPLLRRAGPHPDADMVLSRSADGWTAGTPTAVLLDGRDALLAVGMNGEPLPLEHGFPVRMVVPGLYGYVSATKWVVDLELTRFDRAQGFWTPRGWSAMGPVKTATRIDVPSDGGHVPAGPVPVAGVAWAEHRGIGAVQVQLDDGAWQPARLAAVPSTDTWRQWVWTWDATPGKHLLRARAVDGRSQVQIATPAPPAPDGATGYHTIEVRVG